MQHFKNQNKGNITINNNWNTYIKSSGKVQYNNCQNAVEWAFAATCPWCQARHIFGIVISNIPCLLLAKPPQSNEKYKGCRAN